MTVTQKRLARFNRVIANPIIGRPMSWLPGFGAVFHRGRRSGRQYRTPVKVFRRGEAYLISLPYGPQCDWVKNVMAAGGCELLTGGRRVRLVDPKIFVDTEQRYVRFFIRAALLRLNITEFVAMVPAEVLQPQA